MTSLESRHRSMLAALLLIAAPLRAQEDRSNEVHHRNECRLAAQVIGTGHPAGKLKWARGRISSCLEDGPVVLAQAWRTVPADTVEVEWLRFSSGRIRDARLYSQLQQTVLDRSRPGLVRVGAMLVLLKYVDPPSALWFSDLRPPPDSIRRIPLVSAWTTGAVQFPGSEPLARPVGREVLALLEQVAAQRAAESQPVWYAAAVLARGIKFDIEAGRIR